MRIVIDSNIVFSAILNTKSKIGQLIIDGSRFFEFYSIGLMKDEIFFLKEKILKATKYSQKQFEDIFYLITKHINFIDDILLTNIEIENAFDLVRDIDENDAMFIALNNHLSADLWTGDKRLIEGLKRKKYFRILTTEILYELFIGKQLSSSTKTK